MPLLIFDWFLCWTSGSGGGLSIYLVLFGGDRFFLKGRVLINDSFVTHSCLFLYRHVWDVLNVLEIACLADELVFEKYDVALGMEDLAVMAASRLALVAGEHDLLSMDLAIRFHSVSVRACCSRILILNWLALIRLAGRRAHICTLRSRVQGVLARLGVHKRLRRDRFDLIV